ncbi:MAG TPA: PQQ-binding-like beta-propeller repeat protein, partial [Nitrososphaeraceae archaeon]|nr:PQQ-binding-like beta-propeller repeat protein [Nitrososphaeraceae archaeon]
MYCNSFAYVEVLQQRQANIRAVTATTIGVIKQQDVSTKQVAYDARYDDNRSLLKPSKSDFGTELENDNNWITVNHDIYGSRNSNQTIIRKDNVGALEVKWRLFNDEQIQDPPIVIGDKGYVQDYSGTIIAFDTATGKVLWKVHAGNGPTMGLTFGDGLIFASTGYNCTVVAINATDGKIVWQSISLGNPKAGSDITSQPLVWKDYVIVGLSGHGDESNGVLPIQGNITALNATNGRIVWNLHTTAGEWVRPGKAPAYNGDASAWSGGSLDPDTGIMYIPLG